MKKIKINYRSGNRTARYGYALGIGKDEIVIPSHLANFTCRERLHYNWQQSQNLIFNCGFGNQNKVEKLIERTEEILNITNGIKIYNTDENELIVLKTNNWWTTDVRRQFLSCLLRSAKNFTGNNFRTAIFKYGYFRKTRYAVERFLSGKTVCNVPFNGWVGTFSFRTNHEIDQILV